MSAGAFWRASVRRAMALPPVWVGRPARVSAEVEAVNAHPWVVLDWSDAPLPEDIPNCTGALLSPSPDGVPVHAPAETVIRGRGDSFAGDAKTVRDGMGCEGLAPEGSSGARQGCGSPANADQSHISSKATSGRKRGASLGPIDLRSAPSAMDARAALSATMAAPVRLVPVLARGQTVCSRCSGPERVPVPEDFGRDCIERPCPLKVS